MNGIRRQAAPSPPVQIPAGQQTRNIGPQTRGPTPPLYNRPQEEQYPQVFQQGLNQIQQLGNQSQGSYDHVNKGGFATPSMQNQGVATQQQNMYQQQPQQPQQGMRGTGNSPFFTGGNRTPNVRQSYNPNVTQQTPPQNQVYNQMFMYPGHQYPGSGSGAQFIIQGPGGGVMIPQRMQNPPYQNMPPSQPGVFPVPPQSTYPPQSYNPPVYYNQPHAQRPQSAPGQTMTSQAKERRQKHPIAIIDPTTGSDISKELQPHAEPGPAGSGSGSGSESGSGSTPVSVPPEQQVSQSSNNMIAAAFAAQVAAVAYRPGDQQTPPQQQQQQVPPQHQQQAPPQQGPPPPHFQQQQPTPPSQQQPATQPQQAWQQPRPMSNPSSQVMPQPQHVSSPYNPDPSMVDTTPETALPPPQMLQQQQQPVVQPSPMGTAPMDIPAAQNVVPNDMTFVQQQGVEVDRSVPASAEPLKADSVEKPLSETSNEPSTPSLSNEEVPAGAPPQINVVPKSINTASDSPKVEAELKPATPPAVEDNLAAPAEPEPVITETSRETSPDVPLPVVQKPVESLTGSSSSASAETVDAERTSEPTSDKVSLAKDEEVRVPDAVPVRVKTPDVNIVPPSPLEKEPSPDVPLSKTAVPPATSEPVPEITMKEPPRKDSKGKLKKKDLNRKGENMLGTDMDAFIDSLPDDVKPDTTPATVSEKENTEPQPNQAGERDASPVIKEMSPAEDKVPRVEVKVEAPGDAAEDGEMEKTEDGEVEEEDEESAMETKYKYSEEQWSPLNPEGKKHYDREFLLQFQFASEAVTKPAGLPEIPDIILDKPHNAHQSGGGYRREYNDSRAGQQPDSFDFTPKYVWGPPGSGGGGRGGQNQIPRRISGQKGGRMDKGGPGGGGGTHRINLSIQKDVALHQADHAWKPNRKDEKETTEEETKTAELYKKARSILNKLTPQKFQTLVSQMQAMKIDTESRLKGVIDLVFEKAISEPNFSVAYANMCRCLSTFKVPSENKSGEMVNFRAVLLTRCQREFEKDKSSEQIFSNKRKEIEAAEDSKKEELKAELAYEEAKTKRRTLGNIRFIGELFKLKMLTEAIMHDCLFKLLRTKDPENLECLCRLLTTIGKELDTDKAKLRMDQYFQQMGKIVNEKKTSSRVRFMLQDVIELRLNKWVPRRDDNNPKTIDQIHREVAKEAQEKAIMSQQNLVQQKATKGSSGGGGGGGGRRGPMGGQADGWNTVGNRTPLRSVDRTIDPSKMKISRPQQVDESIQLGPGGGAGRFAGWGRGSTGGGARTSQESERPSNPANRFSALGKEEEGGRRGFGAVSPARGEGRGRGFGRPTTLPARQSQESEREKAIAAAKSIGHGQSSEGGRERSRGREPEKTPAPEKQQSPVLKPLSSEEIQKKTHAILDEYLHIQDIKEAILCVKELPVGNHHDLCMNSLNHVLERSAVARKQTGHLLHDLVKQNIVSVQSYQTGLKEVLEYAEDMAIDIPKIWQYLGELVSPMVQDGSVPLSFLKEACEPLKESNKAGVLVAEVLRDASHREGHKKVAELWSQSGLQWQDFIPKNQIDQFLEDQKLEYTKSADSAPTTPTTGLPMKMVEERLQELVVSERANNEEVFDWIESSVDIPTTKMKAFIRALMTAVCKGAIAGEGSNAKVDPKEVKRRNDLLQKYLDHQAESELQALYALQALVTKLEHPPGVLRQMFDTLYDEDIISEDAFIQWEKSDDPSEQEGKGVAMKQVVQFFTWLKEADDDADS